MPRNMSFMLTIEQIKNKTKTVTRRLGWWFLKPGDLLWACEKCQGLKKGEKVNKLALIRVVSSMPEQLISISKADVVREGFPEMTPAEFVQMFIKHMPKHRAFFVPIHILNFENTWQLCKPGTPNSKRSENAVETTGASWVNRIEFEYVDGGS